MPIKTEGFTGSGKTLAGAATSVRARLPSCRKCSKIIVGFSPCGTLFSDFSPNSDFFRSLISSCGLPFGHFA